MNKGDRVGFDLDGIFIDSPPIVPKKIVEFLYKKSNKTLYYRIPGGFEKKIRILSHHPLLRPPIRDNINALSDIDHRGALTILISSRFSFLKRRTDQLMRRYELETLFKKIHFNSQDEQPHIFKDRIIKQEKIGKFVDDDLDLLLYLAQRNPRVDFFLLSGAARKEELPKNLRVIKTLRDLI